MWGKEIEKRTREIKQNIVTINGSSSIPLVLPHPGLPNGGSPRVILLRLSPLCSSRYGYCWGGCWSCSHNLGRYVWEATSFPTVCHSGNFCLDMLTGMHSPDLGFPKAGICTSLSQIPPFCAHLKFLLWWLILQQVPSVVLMVFEAVSCAL